MLYLPQILRGIYREKKVSILRNFQRDAHAYIQLIKLYVQLYVLEFRESIAIIEARNDFHMIYQPRSPASLCKNYSDKSIRGKRRIEREYLQLARA